VFYRSLKYVSRLLRSPRMYCNLQPLKPYQIDTRRWKAICCRSNRQVRSFYRCVSSSLHVDIRKASIPSRCNRRLSSSNGWTSVPCIPRHLLPRYQQVFSILNKKRLVILLTMRLNIYTLHFYGHVAMKQGSRFSFRLHLDHLDDCWSEHKD